MPDDTPFYTRPLYQVDVSSIALEARRKADGIEIAYGSGEITKTVVGYGLYTMGLGREKRPAVLQPLEEPLSLIHI